MGYKYCSYIRIWSDGSSQRNKMGVGVVLRPGMEPKIYKEIYGLIDPVENKQNHFVAEWASIVVALNLCLSVPGVKRIDLYNDNQTVVDQINGKARIRKIHLAKLHAEATRLIHILREQGVDTFKFYHVNKRHNSYADSLSQKAIEGEEIRLNIWEPLEPSIVEPVKIIQDDVAEPIKPTPTYDPAPPVPIAVSPEDTTARAEQSRLMKEYIAEKKALQKTEQHVDDGPGFVASTTPEEVEGLVIPVEFLPDVNSDMTKEELQAVIDKATELLKETEVRNLDEVSEKKEAKKGFAGLKI